MQKLSTIENYSIDNAKTQVKVHRSNSDEIIHISFTGDIVADFSAANWKKILAAMSKILPMEKK